MLDSQQELQRFEQRYDEVVAGLHLARAESEDIKRQYLRTYAQCQQARTEHQEAVRQFQELRLKLKVKQQVITLLLPYYPHPITPKLRHQIDY